MSEHRRFPRIPTANTVLVTRVGEEVKDRFGRTQTMGLGGCGFVAEETLDLGSLVHLMIAVRPRAVQAQGRVVYCNERDDGLGYDVGVEFVDISPDDLYVVAELVRNEMQNRSDEESEPEDLAG
ncbi:MAG: PilZ domain-containing protein [Thermoanaerobaculia bacterium]|nr:PilZ domain-containing protein [Thermoanaerobaculia bacterium]